VELFQFFAKLYGLRKSEGPVAVGQQQDLFTNRLTHSSGDGQLTVQLKAARSKLERPVTTLDQLLGFFWKLILGADAVRIVHHRSIAHYFVAQPTAIELSNRLPHCLATQVVQGNIDSSEGATISKTRAPKRTPQLAVLQWIFSKEHRL